MAMIALVLRPDVPEVLLVLDVEVLEPELPLEAVLPLAPFPNMLLMLSALDVTIPPSPLPVGELLLPEPPVVVSNTGISLASIPQVRE